MHHRQSRINALTGWQRLWLVASLLWLVAIPMLASTSFPTEAKWEAETLARIIEASTANRVATEEIKTGCWAQSEKSGELLDYALCMEANRIPYQNSIARSREDAARIQEQGNLRIHDTLLTEQFKSVGLAALLWLIPVGTVYLLGVAGAWVVQGFRRAPGGGA